MNKELCRKSGLPGTWISFLLIAISTVIFSCNNEPADPEPSPVDSTSVSSISWNILFDSSAKPESRELAFNKLRDSLNSFIAEYNADHGTDIGAKIAKPIFCVCDSFLYNFNARFVVNGTGASASTPPPPPAGPAGKGDLASVKYIANNNIISELNYLDNADTLTKFKESLGPGTVDPNTILAIIDTGLDTTLFVPKIKDLVWASNNSETYYNFLPGEKADELLDDHKAKHGSGVTAVALQAIGNIGKYPKLMVLKALDSEKKGSIFSVSCALSYAVQQHATLVNASLGYFGDEDSIFHHYLLRIKNHSPNSIKLFAAAGNTDEIHDNTKYCSPGTNNNEIKTKLFYPACYNTRMDNLVSVTGLSSPTNACFYQFFSKEYVSLGILNKSSAQCCIYTASFINKIYEGSSFATPVATGIMTRSILKFGLNTPAMKSAWEGEILTAVSTPATPFVTLKGHYILYTGRQ